MVNVPSYCEDEVSSHAFALLLTCVSRTSLYDAGEVTGAGLEVMPEDPSEPSPLLDRDDVVTTPHVAWYSEESYEKLRQSATEDVIRAIQGGRPDGLADPAVLGDG